MAFDELLLSEYCQSGESEKNSFEDINLEPDWKPEESDNRNTSGESGPPSCNVDYCEVHCSNR